jgi:hypothetical protein
MPADMPPAPPEAEVIRLARNATGMSAQSAAEATKAHGGRGVSATYWRDVERGHGGRRGQQVAVKASDRTLAAMARVVGVAPGQLAGADRKDAAAVLEEILRREDTGAPALAAVPADPKDGSVYDLMRPFFTNRLEKIIWDTTWMSEAQRLDKIEELRAKQAELKTEIERRERNHGTGLTCAST